MSSIATSCEFEILVEANNFSLGGFSQFVQSKLSLLSLIFIFQISDTQNSPFDSLLKNKKKFSASKYLQDFNATSMQNHEPKHIVSMIDLFLSSPRRNPASASAAKRLPVPASSFFVTAYSLTKACFKCQQYNGQHSDPNTDINRRRCIRYTFGPSRAE